VDLVLADGQPAQMLVEAAGRVVAQNPDQKAVMAAPGKLIVAGVEQRPPDAATLEGAQHIQHVELARDVAPYTGEAAAREPDEPPLPFRYEGPGPAAQSLAPLPLMSRDGELIEIGLGYDPGIGLSPALHLDPRDLGRIHRPRPADHQRVVALRGEKRHRALSSDHPRRRSRRGAPGQLSVVA
jgi:hypothetical protein